MNIPSKIDKMPIINTPTNNNTNTSSNNNSIPITNNIQLNKNTPIINNKEEKTKKNICFKCKKYKSVLLKCNCENIFCCGHIQPEMHTCTKLFMYINKSKKELEDKLLTEKTNGIKVDTI